MRWPTTNEFFAIVSHELRTPLTSILAYARILNADDSLAPKTREAVGEIESNATLLLNMVNNILVISKHAAKKDELLPEPVTSSIWPSSCARRWPPSPPTRTCGSPAR